MKRPERLVDEQDSAVGALLRKVPAPEPAPGATQRAWRALEARRSPSRASRFTWFTAGAVLATALLVLAFRGPTNPPRADEPAFVVEPSGDVVVTEERGDARVVEVLRRGRLDVRSNHEPVEVHTPADIVIVHHAVASVEVDADGVVVLHVERGEVYLRSRDVWVRAATTLRLEPGAAATSPAAGDTGDEGVVDAVKPAAPTPAPGAPAQTAARGAPSQGEVRGLDAPARADNVASAPSVQPGPAAGGSTSPATVAAPSAKARPAAGGSTSGTVAAPSAKPGPAAGGSMSGTVAAPSAKARPAAGGSTNPATVAAPSAKPGPAAGGSTSGTVAAPSAKADSAAGGSTSPAVAAAPSAEAATADDPPPPSAATLEATKLRAALALRRVDPAAAAAQLRRLSSSPTHGEVALYELGRLQAGALAQPAAAAATFREARARFPGGALRVEVAVSLVEALLAARQPADALSELELVSTGEAGRERGDELVVLRGDILRGLGRCDEAVPSVAPAAARDSRFAARALIILADCEARRGHDADARAALREYLRRFPAGEHAAEARRALGE